MVKKMLKQLGREELFIEIGGGKGHNRGPMVPIATRIRITCLFLVPKLLLNNKSYRSSGLRVEVRKV